MESVVRPMDDFLHSRSQTVFLDGTRSYSAEVPSGVPKGSDLGPYLLLFFISGMP